jgi:hypothetical protein
MTMPWRRSLPGVLIGMGIALAVLAFLLAFTLFGEIAASAGVALLVVGSAMTGRRTPQKAPLQPGEN